MSYKSLLFCLDERAAGLITQVLSELEFTVDSADETFAAVKRLTDERFDALVVDCQSEQDASLLFKAARNSAQNHSALSVAVVEGQAGVAKAFRIGANLVLTKPINIEQSKSTLRVARGLLRKHESKSAVSTATQAADSSASFTTKPFASAAAASGGALSTPAPAAESVPFASLEMEPDPTPAPEAAEIAVLESLPDLDGAPASKMVEPTLRSQTEPIAASTAGAAAAAVMAPEKSPALGATSAMPPMVTNEPIISSHVAADPFVPAPVEVPSFSTLAAEEKSGGGKFLKVAAIAAIIFVAGYWAWQKFQPLKYLHRGNSEEAAQVVSEPAPHREPAAPAPQATKPDEPPVELAANQPSNPAAWPENSDIAALKTPRTVQPEHINVEELPISKDAKPTLAPKTAPLVVKNKPTVVNAGPVAPPALPAPPTGDADSTLKNIISTDSSPMPTVAPNSLRVSQGVSQGLVLKKVPPVYPAAALQLRKEGTVDLLATVTRTGSIGNVRVLSGDSMLAQAAVNAVRQWKYRPYLLNNEPVEIETQITINFKLPR